MPINTPDPEHQKYFEDSFIKELQGEILRKIAEDREKLFYTARKNSTLDRIWRKIYGKRFVSQITKDLLKPMKQEKQFTDSTQVKTIWYNEEAKEMEVLFMANKRYVYYDVPLEVWQKAISAESIGKFINSEIKDKYKYKLI